jgi:hypothetical protein
MEQSDALEKLWNLLATGTPPQEIGEHRNVSRRPGKNAVHPVV